MWALVLAGVICLILSFIVKAWRVNQHWKNRGIPYIKPVLFFGNLLDVIIKRRTRLEILKSAYDAFPDEPVVGTYHYLNPQLMIRDQGLISRLLISDFSHFVDHGPSIDYTHNLLSVNLFTMTGPVWKAFRTQLSPVFTSSKLRSMTPRMAELSNKLIERINSTTLDYVDIRGLAQRFVLDVTGSCTFGINVDTINGKDKEFHDLAVAASSSSFSSLCRKSFAVFFTNASRILGINLFSRETEDYFGALFRSIFKEREEAKEPVNDFVQSLINMKKAGVLPINKHKGNESKVVLSDELFVGQTFSILLGGLETTAMTMTMACVELAANPKCQKLAREEILKAIDNEGSFNFDAVKSMDYLERFVKETLRLHPPTGWLDRYCVKPYTIPGTSIHILEGDRVIISTAGVHLDPSIYPDPLTFNPDRWLTEKKLAATTYLPFGEGPRICVASKFAVLEIKYFVAQILMNYEVNLHPSETLPIKMDPHAFLELPAKNPIFVFKKIVRE